MFDNWLATIRPTGGFCAIILFLLNVFLPGVGTICNALCCGAGPASCMEFLIGILQLLTAGFLLGWIWSIWWGVEIMRRSGVC